VYLDISRRTNQEHATILAMSDTRLSSRGFTLIEILMVISIIGILASVIMPTLNEARDEAMAASTIVELGSIRAAMNLLYDDTGNYSNGATSYCRTTIPSNNEVDLSSANAGLTGNGLAWTEWAGPYMSDATDAWGTPYYLDEDYQCFASTTGCEGIADATPVSSVIVSCGPNAAVSGGSCDYDTDNIVFRLCD
jgi:prepilin-type N-terminal cleavage/methylation domain-containing protein